MTEQNLSLLERFERKFSKAGGCWEWTNYKNKKGYGQIMVSRGVYKLAHRISYEFYIGDIPSGLFVCHKCDNPSCVNPEHLFIGTHDDNMLDMTKKGRHHNKKKTHCKSGHKFTDKNTGISRRGHRFCRACSVTHAKNFRARKKKNDTSSK